MSKLPVAFENAGLSINTESLAEALGGVSAGGEGANSLNGRELLKMSKDGEWSFGQDMMEVIEEDLIAVNPNAFQHGYVSWKDSKIASEVMVPIMHALPDRAGLPNTGEKWDEQLQFDAQIVEGDFLGTPLIYKVSSMGGKEAIRQLARRIVGQLVNSQQFVVPVISVGNTSYKHKKYGKIYKPDFKIHYWIDFNGEPQPKGIANKAKEKPEPETEAKEKPEPETEAEAETKPKRGRPAKKRASKAAEPEAPKAAKAEPEDEEAETAEQKPASRRRRRVVA